MFYLIHIIFPLIVFVLLAHVAYVLGRTVTHRIAFSRDVSAISLGISLLIGYGICAYGALVLSLFPPLSKMIIWVLFAAILILGRKIILELYRAVFTKKTASGSYLPRAFQAMNNVEKISCVLIVFAFIFYISSAFVPPYRVDALAYHIPEAIQIAEQGIMSLGGIGNFFGNQPLLMETLYAPLYVIAGYSAMNLAHYAIFLSACIAVYGFVRVRFGRLAGMWSVLGIFSIYELLVNATNPYVDAATVSFEIVGILLFLEWALGIFAYAMPEASTRGALQKPLQMLMLSGMMYGFALSTKHLPFYSIIILAALFIAVHIVKKYGFKLWLQHAFAFAIPVILVSGFWYAKSYALTGNPLYPFIFGHEGFSREIIESMNIAVQQFGSRSLKAFVALPYTFFYHPLYLHVLGSFVLIPFIFFIKKHRTYIRILTLISVAYFTLWFFFISHQRRFVMTAMVLLIVCVAMALGHLFEKISIRTTINRYAWPACALVFIIGVAGGFMFKHNYYVQAKTAEWLYIAGIDTDADFYEKRGMGPIYNLSAYINDHLEQEKILNLWADQNFFLQQGNYFVGPEQFIHDYDQITTSTFLDYLNRDNIKYVSSMSEEAKQTRLNDEYFKTNPAEQDYYEDVLKYVLEIEPLLNQITDTVYAAHDRVLYRVK